ncbi:helix-turn-helix domain-containing protein [Streptomyces liangshanensis]|uniref:Helix-turn-helix transcriptional regulator n=1 Tax=Streptomyces liangshanensis TaxID=2717324 RepID=A0A6G9GXI9_9ACTN|nr:helix-turn-helix transcriptional regulator [Streptomyces liangshanensis]QIQ02934.1 helix-turn-helix transcriptional regulator [Streptomyces liangshanensis]
MSHNELGLFLRARREALTPAQVGLPGGSRRRTPGLRRSELAMLAGISVEYLARLEQGRDRHPSPQVLGALAEALRLTDDERFALMRAEKAATGTLGLCPGAGSAPARTVRPSVRALLDRLEPTPAVLVNRLTEVLAYTEGYERLVAPLGVLDSAAPNLARYVFTDRRARTVLVDWEREADALVARLRTGSVPEDHHLASFVEELSGAAGALFTDRWALAARTPENPLAQRVAHPVAGALHLTTETLELPGLDSPHLVVHLPADEATSAALDRLTGRRPGALHVVAG